MNHMDAFERVARLFCRVLQRDSTERPSFMVVPLDGSQWGAAVYIGEAPEILAKHYARGRGVQEPPARGDSFCSSVGDSPSSALHMIECELIDDLRDRIQGDLGVWEQVTGEPWPGAAPVARVPANPESPDAHETFKPRRALPAR